MKSQRLTLAKAAWDAATFISEFLSKNVCSPFIVGYFSFPTTAPVLLKTAIVKLSNSLAAAEALLIDAVLLVLACDALDDADFGISPGSKFDEAAALGLGVLVAELEAAVPFCIGVLVAFGVDTGVGFCCWAAKAIKVPLKSTLYFGWVRIQLSRVFKVGALSPVTVCFVSGFCIQTVMSENNYLVKYFIF